MSSLLELKTVILLLRQKGLLVSEMIPASSRNSLKCSGICTDSRQLKKNDIFICLSGYQTDGHLFARKAAEKGASLLICQKKPDINHACIIVNNSRLAAAWLCRHFYQIDDSKMKLVGITGTNGKSTTGWLMYQLAGKLGKKAGFIGTIGCYYKNKYLKTSLTTPDIIEIFELLAKMQAEGVEVVFIEASSHALYLERLSALRFSLAAFTNLSQDHLDFHKNMNDYAACKAKLFGLLHAEGKALINNNDPYGRNLLENLEADKFSLSASKGDFVYDHIKTSMNGSEFVIAYQNQRVTFQSRLSGVYNVQNLCFAIAGIFLLYPHVLLEQLAEYSPHLSAAAGRLEKVENAEDKNIYIDYAHTPEAIRKVTEAVKDFTRDRLITIIGAGGNRDTTKRPLMLKAALEYSDLVIVTTDNPRFENPLSIIADIISQADNRDCLWIKENRSEAITDALLLAGKDDTILITGKGHETYQEIKGKKEDFDDRKVISRYFSERKRQHLKFDRIMLEFICTGKINTNYNQTVKQICTDTRKLLPDSLFIPIKGNRYDGHDYIDLALKDSSIITLSDQDYYLDNDRVIHVDNTIVSYGLIARSYRRLFNCKIIAITGSTGKTSVKEYLYNLLSQAGNTLRTHANENNYIGVSKTLLYINPSNRFAVIELGTNHFGEIRWLAQITLPDIAVITNIGKSHLEFLENEAGVFKEKIEIFSIGAPVKIFPGDDSRFSDVQGISFGKDQANTYQIHKITKKSEGYGFSINGKDYILRSQAEFQVINASIAIIAAEQAGLDDAEVRKGLSKPLVLPLRMQEIPSGDKLVIADCYNANPHSMEAAINYWLNLEPDRPHIAILGSMLELGSASESSHKEIGRLLSKSKLSLVISVGSEARLYGTDVHFEQAEALMESEIIRNLPSEAVILIKGSHGIHLEKLIKEYNPQGIF